MPHFNSAPHSSDCNTSLALARHTKSETPRTAQAHQPDQDTGNKPSFLVGLTSEQRARIAVLNAFRFCPQHFLEHFVIHRVIGYGTNGVVLSATDARTKADVAIKIIYKPSVGGISDPLPNEIVLLKRLANTSQFILQYMDDWQDANHFYLVSELFGNNWADVAEDQSIEMHPIILRSMNNEIYVFSMTVGSSDLYSWSFAYRWKFYRSTGYSMLPIKPIKFIVRQIAAALYHLHKRGFYHGDIKQENVLVQLPDHASIDRPRIRLADFGHCKHHTQGCTRYGTKTTSAPELLPSSPLYSPDLDGRAGDVYALGLVLYCLLGSTGELPTPNSMDEDIPDLDDGAWELIHGMCNPNPTMRLTIDQVLLNAWLSE
ncbi:kinase-like domain-containing protein [Chytriomyces sp. MP71]|nr:kinase-like domain-containing protein [Chytriomyces sp. MP71]